MGVQLPRARRTVTGSDSGQHGRNDVVPDSHANRSLSIMAELEAAAAAATWAVMTAMTA